MQLDYYLALLQLHIAVVGVVIAGIVALVQLLNSSKPRRNINLLVRAQTLVLYGGLLVGLLALLALGSWVNAFPDKAAATFGDASVHFFTSGSVGLGVVALMLLSLAWFGVFAAQARTLLDTQSYLRAYVRRTSPHLMRKYLLAIYTDDKPAAMPSDPFQPIREYVKDNAFKYYDYGTADGLRHFSNLFDKSLAYCREHNTDQAEYERLARFISESCEEFFRIFVKTASEKRKTDTINLLYAKGRSLLEGTHDESHVSLLPIVHGLENIAKISDDDDEVIDVIICIRNLCDAFLASHKDHDWQHIAGVFDEICLSLSRITEDYYLQKNKSLKTVPIIGYSTGGHRTVTSALVDFFGTYRNLGDQYTDATPLYYFEAIEGVIEVLFVRLGDIVSNGQQAVGFNMKYHEYARALYQIYYEFGIDAVEHHKPELLAMALTNLRRIIKPAKNFGLYDERQEICTMVIELAVRGVDVLGDVAIKSDGRTISAYTQEIVQKHATRAQISQALADLKKIDALPDKPTVKSLVRRIAA